jgi:transcriptional regulator with XRE-family HTH domain
MRDKFLLQIGLLIKAARQEAGLYQADLATRAGVPQSFISRIERGEQDLVVVVHCLRLMRALDLKLELVERALGVSVAETGDPSTGPVRGAAPVPLEAGDAPSRVAS